MSLINKMLQDLDARGEAAGAPPQAAIKPVVRKARRPARWMMAAAALVLMVLMAGGYAGWRTLRHQPVVVLAPAPVTTVLLEPSPLVEAVVMAPEPVAPEAPEAPAPSSSPSPPSPLRKEKKEAKLPAAALKKPEPAAAPTAQILSAAQRAETQYRGALATLAEGRGGDAIAGLEQALQSDPRHEAARQTLVGLLIENKRLGDAMRQLHVALAADPRQTAMAMLLARLQIERGGSGVDILQRSLTYAAGNAEYYAFYAGALQRQQRHGDAAEQYGAALRANPQNGVWLMGLGISLQAEKHNAEAIAAFRKAKASTSLTPELRAFVERKLVQLGQ